MKPLTELLDDFSEIFHILFDDLYGFLQTRGLGLRNFPISLWSVRLFHAPRFDGGDKGY